MMFDPYPGHAFNAPAPQPYYAPPQPKPAPAKPRAAPVRPPASTPVVVPAPEELGIHLPDAPVVVPAPRELGIDLE